MTEVGKNSSLEIDDLIPDITQEISEELNETIDVLEDINENEVDVLSEDFDVLEGEEKLVESTNTEDEKDSIEINQSNLIPLLAAQLKEEGIFDDTFEVNEKTSHSEIVESYKKIVEETAYKEILNDFQSKLIEEGFTEETLKHAKLLGNGFSVEDVTNLVNLDTIVKQEFKGVEDKDNLNLIKRFLEETTASKKLIQKTIDDALFDEESFKDLFDESIKYFKDKKEEDEKEMLEIANREAALRREAQEKTRQTLKKVVEEGVVLGTKIPNKKKFQEGIYQLDEVVEVNGEKRNISKLGKFLLEFNKNVELQLWAFNQRMFFDEIVEKEKVEAEKTAEINLLNHFTTTRTKGVSIKPTPTTQKPQNITLKKHIVKF